MADTLWITYLDDDGIWDTVEGVVTHHLQDVRVGPSERACKFVFLRDTDHRLRFQGRPFNWWRVPLLHLYVVKCEDVSHYKSAVRPKLKRWSGGEAGRPSEWLVVYIPLGNRSGTPVDEMRRNYDHVFEKMRDDLGVQRDRACRIDMFQGGRRSSSDDLWETFTAALVGGVTRSYNERCNAYRVELQRFKARPVPFSDLFITQEGLALLHEQVGRLSDAVKIYDALAGLLTETNLAALPQELDFDLSDVLDIRRRDFREQIVRNEISVHSLRAYVYARRANLFIQMQRFSHSSFLTLVFGHSQLDLTPAAERTKAHAWLANVCFRVLRRSKGTLSGVGQLYCTLARFVGALQQCSERLFAEICEHFSTPIALLPLRLTLLSWAANAFETDGNRRLKLFALFQAADAAEQAGDAQSVSDNCWKALDFSSVHWSTLGRSLVQKLVACETQLGRLHMLAKVHLLAIDALELDAAEHMAALLKVASQLEADAEFRVSRVVKASASVVGQRITVKCESLFPAALPVTAVHLHLTRGRQSTDSMDAREVSITRSATELRVGSSEWSFSASAHGLWTIDRLTFAVGRLLLARVLKPAYRLDVSDVGPPAQVSLVLLGREPPPTQEVGYELFVLAGSQIRVLAKMTLMRGSSVSFRSLQVLGDDVGAVSFDTPLVDAEQSSADQVAVGEGNELRSANALPCSVFSCTFTVRVPCNGTQFRLGACCSFSLASRTYESRYWLDLELVHPLTISIAPTYQRGLYQVALRCLDWLLLELMGVVPEAEHGRMIFGALPQAMRPNEVIFGVLEVGAAASVRVCFEYRVSACAELLRYTTDLLGHVAHSAVQIRAPERAFLGECLTLQAECPAGVDSEHAVRVRVVCRAGKWLCVGASSLVVASAGESVSFVVVPLVVGPTSYPTVHAEWVASGARIQVFEPPPISVSSRSLSLTTRAVPTDDAPAGAPASQLSQLGGRSLTAASLASARSASQAGKKS